MDGSKDDRPIVVGVDRSGSARDAVGWAADIAAILRAPLQLLTVNPDNEADAAIPGWLAELRDAAVRAGAESAVVEVASGGVVEIVADRACAARMLVLGSYGEGAWSGMLAGTVALTLLTEVSCPIAVIRGTAQQIPPPRGGPVVVGVDGSPAGRAALGLAADLATALGSRLVAVHAWSDITFGVNGAARRSREDDSVHAAHAAAVLDAQLPAVTRDHPGLQVHRVVVADTPLRALLAAAEGARLLVVGHRGFAAGPGRSLGSTSRALIEFVPCPVVVARPQTNVSTPVDSTQVTGASS